MARNANDKKNRQVNATISGDLFEALDDYRWDARIDGMTALTKVALEEYATNHDVVAKFEAKKAAAETAAPAAKK